MSVAMTATLHIYARAHVAEALALLCLAAATVLLALLVRVVKRGRESPDGGALNGRDNRWSTSKVAVVLWTYALLFAFIVLLIRYRAGVFPKDVQEEYFLVLGIPSIAALAAKAITRNAVEQGSLVKTKLTAPTLDPVRGIGQIFTDDAGAVDLLNTQYFAFNLVLLSYFLIGFLSSLPTEGEIHLPDLPNSLLALSGVAAGSYIGKKALPGDVGGDVKVPGGSRLVLPADSRVDLPSGGKITVPPSGSVRVATGQIATASVDGQVRTAGVGSMRPTTACSMHVSAGAIVRPPSNEGISFTSTADVRVSAGADIRDAAHANVVVLNGVASVPAGGSVLLSDGPLILAADADITAPQLTTIEFGSAGSVAVGQAIIAEISAAATLRHPAIATVTFPNGAAGFDGSAPGQLQDFAPGQGVEVRAAVADNPELSFTLTRPAAAALPSGTRVEYPGSTPTTIAANVPQTVAQNSTISLSAGGTITFDVPAAVYAAAGSIVEVPSGNESASVASDGSGDETKRVNPTVA